MHVRIEPTRTPASLYFPQAPDLTVETVTGASVNTSSAVVSDMLSCSGAGSCLGRCHTLQEAGDCSCDEMCHYYSAGCCCDYKTFCDKIVPVTLPALSTQSALDQDQEEDQDGEEDGWRETCLRTGDCLHRCGGGSDRDCWCDEHCADRGDCCCDKLATCPAPQPDTTAASPTVTATVCTTNSRGPVKLQPCTIPFNFFGSLHHSCIETWHQGEPTSWCATKLGGPNSTDYISGQWGFCQPETCAFSLPETSPATGGNCHNMSQHLNYKL